MKKRLASKTVTEHMQQRDVKKSRVYSMTS